MTAPAATSRVGSLAYRVAGEGPPLLLLHGFTGAATTWAPHVAAWAPFFRCIAVDLPGHGESATPSDPACYTMAATVAALAGVLDRLGVARAHVLGYSLGGRIALGFALARPERVGALVLESAAPGLVDPVERAARVAADEVLADAIERDGISAFVERWEQMPLWQTQARLPAATRAALREQRLGNNAAGLANSLRGIGAGAQSAYWAALPALAAPTLLIAGRDDAKFSALAGAMAAAIPRNELLIVHGAGHAAHLEQPAVFDRLVRDFLLAHNDPPPATGLE